MFELKSNVELTGSGTEIAFQCLMNGGSARIEARAVGRSGPAAGWSLAGYFTGSEWKRLKIPAGCQYRAVLTGGARVWQVK